MNHPGAREFTTPRRRNWWEPFRTRGGRGGRKADRSKSRVHDFPSQAEGHAIPYGTYDVA
ncbi:MAG: hypothetical protein DMG24_22565 [Acidobacteria bacterium]|nr:MAG: hypothetical protein DMG24_22565 [Acidobacteriota bacterium]